VARLFIAHPLARTVRSLRSIAPLCPSNSSNQSCSATNGVPLPGPQQSKVGQIELASHGVLFSTNHEMSLSAQAKFLRALQEHEFSRLGGTRPIKANVRGDPATNRDLRKAVERARFARTCTTFASVRDHDSALRDRKSDVLRSRCLLARHARSFGRPVAGLTADSKRALLEHRWPGTSASYAMPLNGPQSCARRLDLASTPRASAERLLPRRRQPISSGRTSDDRADDAPKTRGNKSKARESGLSRTQLYGRTSQVRFEHGHYITNLPSRLPLLALEHTGVGRAVITSRPSVASATDIGVIAIKHERDTSSGPHSVDPACSLPFVWA